MNKIKYLLAFAILFVVGLVNVDAKEMNSVDIPNNSYVIGTHIFTQDTILTTKHIMLASKTVKDNSLDDMIIYYKTPRGAWIDGLSGESVNVPNSFEIKYIDLELVITFSTPVIEMHALGYGGSADTVYQIINTDKLQGDGFEIYYSESEDGQYELLKTVKNEDYATEESWFPVSGGKHYYIKIRFYIYVGAEDIYSDYSNIVEINNVSVNVDASVCTPLNGEISYELGTEYNCDPGDGTERTFYVLEENGDNVLLIMDRNIGGMVAWISKEDYLNAGGAEVEWTEEGNNDRGPLTAINYLFRVTSEWNNVTVNLLTEKQIADAGGDTEWTDDHYTGKVLSNWLYQNLNCNINECTEPVSGDTAKTGTVNRYWTASPRASNSAIAWNVYINYLSLNVSNEVGVRPVITLLKSQFFK